VKRLVVAAARKRILYLPHAIKQMARPDRMITVQEIRRAVMRGEVIEEYPEDARGVSCLMLGTGSDNRKLHVVCAPKKDYLAIITAYLPDPREWDTECRSRRT
jgi:hypothetical protein